MISDSTDSKRFALKARSAAVKSACTSDRRSGASRNAGSVPGSRMMCIARFRRTGRRLEPTPLFITQVRRSPPGLCACAGYPESPNRVREKGPYSVIASATRR